MTSANQKYMDARLALSNAIEEYKSAAYSVGFDDRSIAATILDCTYDSDPGLYTEIQKECLPMVKEFQLTKSDRYDEMKKDWEQAVTEWEKKQMWKMLQY